MQLDGMLVTFGGCVFQQTVAYLWVQAVFLFSPTLLIWGKLHTGVSQEKNKKKPARSFKLTFRCIDYVFLLHNSKFGAFVDRIYPIGFEIKDTTDTFRSVSYLDLHSEINSEGR